MANAASSPPWDERNALIASLIPELSTVLDLGAGAQTLRTHLRDLCVYQPCDVVKTTADTWLVDFNHGIYPDTDVVFDYVVLSGVLEYATNLSEPLAHAALCGRTVIASYSPVSSETRKQREKHGWFNHLTRDELESTFGSLGLDHELVNSCLDGQLVYRLKRQLTPNL
jgi:hypothetical protein